MGPLAPVIHSVLEELSQGVKERRSVLQGHWEQIMGNQLSTHTKPQLQPGGTLCVWVDDSTLASELRQRYLGTILKRTGNVLGEGAIKKIVFRVGELR